MSSSSSPWTTVNTIYDLFVAHPWAFFAILFVWAVVVLFFQRGLHIHISPWWGLLTLIVSVGIVIGILYTFFI